MDCPMEVDDILCALDKEALMDMHALIKQRYSESVGDEFRLPPLVPKPRKKRHGRQHPRYSAVTAKSSLALWSMAPVPSEDRRLHSLAQLTDLFLKTGCYHPQQLHSYVAGIVELFGALSDRDNQGRALGVSWIHLVDYLLGRAAFAANHSGSGRLALAQVPELEAMEDGRRSGRAPSLEQMPEIRGLSDPSGRMHHNLAVLRFSGRSDNNSSSVLGSERLERLLRASSAHVVRRLRTLSPTRHEAISVSFDPKSKVICVLYAGNYVGAWEKSNSRRRSSRISFVDIRGWNLLSAREQQAHGGGKSDSLARPRQAVRKEPTSSTVLAAYTLEANSFRGFKQPLVGHAKPLSDVASCLDGAYVASIDEGSHVIVWDAVSLSIVSEVPGGLGQLNVLGRLLTPLPSRLLVAGKRFYIIRPNSGAKKRSLSGGTGSSDGNSKIVWATLNEASGRLISLDAADKIVRHRWSPGEPGKVLVGGRTESSAGIAQAHAWSSALDGGCRDMLVVCRADGSIEIVDQFSGVVTRRYPSLAALSLLHESVELKAIDHRVDCSGNDLSVAAPGPVKAVVAFTATKPTLAVSTSCADSNEGGPVWLFCTTPGYGGSGRPRCYRAFHPGSKRAGKHVTCTSLAHEPSSASLLCGCEDAPGLLTRIGRRKESSLVEFEPRWRREALWHPSSFCRSGVSQGSEDRANRSINIGSKSITLDLDNGFLVVNTLNGSVSLVSVSTTDQQNHEAPSNRLSGAPSGEVPSRRESKRSIDRSTSQLSAASGNCEGRMSVLYTWSASEKGAQLPLQSVSPTGSGQAIVVCDRVGGIWLVDILSGDLLAQWSPSCPCGSSWLALRCVSDARESLLKQAADLLRQLRPPQEPKDSTAMWKRRNEPVYVTQYSGRVGEETKLPLLV
ncbi:hypothetical protein FOZ60_005199 [Perkinsus olseni]|uniref:Uncharacterized protein n=1 Tax=Perkinsus olseni TaxID=32597 RepID=A0A7J6NRH4_PEROL|nr:hypothetical protein FOZ60_005199 [Perkinsus olseni]